MRICFSLAWMKSGQPIKKAFKSASACGLFTDYLERIGRFAACEAGANKAQNRGIIWVCEREKSGKMFRSEDLAQELQKVMNGGAQELSIVIGGADGFTVQELEAMRPALRWSFGPMTLPHELAAVVAAEQIYRALTILRNMPYHSGH